MKAAGLNAFAVALARLGESVPLKKVEQVRARFALCGFELNASGTGFEVKSHNRRAVLTEWWQVEMILADVEGASA